MSAGTLLPAPGVLLVASQRLTDPSFLRSVVYLVEHSDDGSLGFIVNRPLDIPLADLWSDCPACLGTCTVAGEGGPVERHKGLLLHGVGDIPGAAAMGAGVFIGGDLTRIADRWAGGPDERGPRLLLGHSGWAPGQLEREIAEGAWLLRPGSADLLITGGDPERLWFRLGGPGGPGGGRGLPEPSLN